MFKQWFDLRESNSFENKYLKYEFMNYIELLVKSNLSRIQY